MTNRQDEKAEIAAAKERLKRFVRKASECRNYHDPVRFARMRENLGFQPLEGWRLVAHDFGVRLP